MTRSKLIRPGWMPRPALDLRYRHFERVRHGIRCIGTWYSENEFRSQPCLVLLPASAPLDNRLDHVVPVVIPLSDLWIFAASDDIGDPDECFTRIMAWLRDGLLPGSPVSKRDVLDVLDAINDSIRDVVNMPPRPEGDARVTVGIGRTTNLSTGRVEEREVTTDV